MGTYFSPWVSEVYLISQGEGLWSIPHLWGLPSPSLSPLGSLWGDMYSRWGPWEHVSPYPGSLGSLFSSQDSWEHLRHVSLGPPLFPGKGVISEACRGRGVPGPPCTSALGVSDLQHFGARLDNS